MAEAKNDLTTKPGSSGWHLALARASSEAEGGYLGDLAVVDGIVRRFVISAAERFTAFAGGGMSLDAVAAEDARAGRDLTLILRGSNLRYSSIGEWNDGGGLAQACRTRFGIKLGAEAQTNDFEAIFQTVGRLLQDVYGTLTAEAQKDDTDGAGPAVAAIVDSYARLFAGVAQP